MTIGSQKPHVLIIEDDAEYRRMVAARLQAAEIKVDEVGTFKEAKKCIEEKRYTYVFIDNDLNGELVGIHLCKFCLAKGIRDFAVVTGFEDNATAKEFLQLGINSFYPKTRFAHHLDDLIRNIRILAQAPQHAALFSTQFVTQSESLKEEVRSFATSLLTKAIFLSGETGVGKTEIAKLIHQLSGAPGQFVHLNCAQTEDALIESELFGHKKGAFTGATSDRKGKMQLAENGTLFLDEIGNLTPRAQEKLLIAIEERKFYPVGSNIEVAVKCRLISATKEDLIRQVKLNRFREDLLYRIMGITLTIPPLRNRPDDIPLLAQFFLNRLPKKMILSDEAMELLKKYRWPGNVRELKHLIESFETKSCGFITPEMLPLEIQRKLLPTSTGTMLTDEQFSMIRDIGLPGFIEALEQEALLRSLSENASKQATAIKALKITKPIYYRIYKGMTHEAEPNPEPTA